MLIVFCNYLFAEGSPTQPKVKILHLKSETLTQVKVYPVLFSAKNQHQIVAPANGFFVSQDLLLGQKVKSSQLLGRLRIDEVGFSPHPLDLKSPADGVLAEVHTSIGTFVRKGDRIFTVFDLTQNEPIIQIPQSDLPLIKAGMHAEIQVSGFQPMRATVLAIAPHIDLATGCARTILRLENKETVLPGTIGRATIALAPEHGFKLDRASIRQLGSKSYVMLIEEQKLKSLEIQVHKELAESVFVKSGLKEGASICAKYPLDLKETTSVEIEE